MLTHCLPRLALGLLVFVMAGCTIAQKGETVVKHDKGQAPIMGQATKDGEYSLYLVTDATPKVTYTLKAGDKLGFEKGADGQLFAVAGQHRAQITDAGYYWKRRF